MCAREREHELAGEWAVGGLVLMLQPTVLLFVHAQLCVAAATVAVRGAVAAALRINLR